MIGSRTFIVKRNNQQSRYFIHILGGTIFTDLILDAAKKANKTPFEQVYNSLKRYENKPDHIVNNEEEMMAIAKATNCFDNKFAGDLVYLVDELQEKLFIYEHACEGNQFVVEKKALWKEIG